MAVAAAAAAMVIRRALGERAVEFGWAMVGCDGRTAVVWFDFDRLGCWIALAVNKSSAIVTCLSIVNGDVFMSCPSLIPKRGFLQRKCVH